MLLRADPTTSEHVPFESTPWTTSPEAMVERKMLERDGEEVARATSIVRYAPGSSFPAHVHEQGEEFIVLEGTFSDEHGDNAAGTYVRNPPGSRHRPFSKGGCIIFVKLRQFAPRDTRHCVLGLEHDPRAVAAASSTLLHSFGKERVSLVRLPAGATMKFAESDGGAELLVLDGSVDVGATHCERWTWLRVPRFTAPLHSTSGGVVWLKQGHLGPRDSRLER